VAGADRLVLTEHIAVMDLMVLGDALLLPQDDLALATALRSPLFGFTEEDLFDIAWNRGRASLRTALARKAGEREIFAAAQALLDTLAQKARSETPFAFYAAILGAGGGRRRFLARLGHEANDALDEFLNLAFEYERRETPSLQGFLAWLREAQTEVKRDMEIARDEVRVMTVHGAKGLEAPIVILADTLTAPAGPRQPRLLGLSGGAKGAMVWAGRKADDVSAVAAARQQALSEAVHEYRRLLYVAMTRAADRLIICGAESRRKRPEGCWYDLVRGALGPFLIEETDGGEKVWRYRKEPAEALAAREALPVSQENTAGQSELPAWLRQFVPDKTPSATPLSPSSAFDEEIGEALRTVGSLADRQHALERGRIVHRLMQSLPDIPPQRRSGAALHYLARASADFSAAEQSDIARQVFAILDDRNFAEVFAPGGRAEVPIVGRIPRNAADPLPVAGQVDRLIITDDAVLIADYKTDRLVPGPTTIPRPYLAQLALYRAVISSIYPGKAVRAALVFTGGPALIEVSAAALDAALAEVLSEVTGR
jgi:ATP-dependent helicase/nuclease subunit A